MKAQPAPWAALSVLAGRYRDVWKPLIARTLRGRLAILPAAVVVAAVFWVTYLGAERRAIRALRETTTHRMDIYSASLQAELSRFEYLPGVVALNEQVVRLLRNPDDKATRDAVNAYLHVVNVGAEASAAYVMNAQGLTLAASNWNQAGSFVNMNFAYRPYFQDAAKTGSGRFYGIGTVSKEAGYYFAHAVSMGDALLGVVAVKLSLEKLDQAWGHDGERIAVADVNGVVFLSSEPTWKYRTLKGLSPETVGRLQSTRQYAEAGLMSPLGIQTLRQLDDGAAIVSIAAEPIAQRPRGETEQFLLHERRVLGTDWRLLVLSELTPARNSALVSSALAALTCLLLGLLAVYFSQRRRFVAQTLTARAALERLNDGLEQKVAQRTDALSDANRLLQAEIGERQRAEAALRSALEDLVHTAKMAALGQMSAGITHELNQPLAALSTLSGNAIVFMKRGELHRAEENLAMIARVTGHMGKITAQLKKFARKAPMLLRPVELAGVTADALFLLSQSDRRAAVKVDQHIEPPGLQALCDASRLEQVLLNLLTNAFDAVQEALQPAVLLQASLQDGWVTIAVHDNGTGIREEVLPHLFEPFYSTKAQGVGLGLGLAISADIVRDLGGQIRASNSPLLGGACFTVQLRAVPLAMDAMEPAHA
jgi:two-component system, NtrC family, C4-dicarboxylate transport sensor histidine kinase DctB